MAEQGEISVYLLWHSRPLDDHPESPETDDKLLGVFNSEARAQEAKDLAVQQPGFAEWSDCFLIDRYVLNQRTWTEGFVTI